MLPVRDMREALDASLEAMPCPACTNDHDSGVSLERAESDPAHCDVCHLNWPTRIEMGLWELELSKSMRPAQEKNPPSRWRRWLEGLSIAQLRS